MRTRTFKILLVEDEAVLSMAQSRRLRKQGYTVLTAPNGARAVSIALEDPDIGLVLMDMDLGPGMDGTEAAAAILARRDLPIIFLSSHREAEYVAKTEEIGSYGYVLKSSGDAVLDASIKMAIRLFDAKNHIAGQESLMRTTLYSIGDGVIVTDAEGKVTRMNAVASALCGYSEADARGHDIRDVFPIYNETTGAVVENPVRRVIKEGTIVGLANHTVLKARDGSVRPIADSGAPIRDAAGQLIGVVLIFRDMTKEREHADRLAESERRFRTMFENASVGMVQVEANEGRIIAFNEAYRAITGYAGNELRNLPFRELTHPDDPEADWALFKRAASGELPFYRNEKRYVRADGTVVWVRVNAAFMRDDSGRPVQTFAVAEDISDRKSAELALARHLTELETSRRESTMLTGLVENARIAIAIAYPDGRFGLMNHACETLLGYPREELRLLNWLVDLTPPEWIEITRTELAKLDRERDFVRYEKEFKRKDGTQVPVSLVTHVVRDKSGAPFYYFSFVEDLTERNAQRATLDALVREKESLLMELQHRVKNSLNMISSLIYLEESESTNEEVRAALGSVHSRVQVLTQLYRQLNETHDSAVRLDDYLRTIGEALEMSYAAARRGIDFQVDLDRVDLDIKRGTNIGLIVHELLVNAFKYAFPEGAAGSIVLRLRKADQAIEISVEDTGVGLPPGFDPVESTGLGFRLITELTAQVNGTFEVLTSKGAGFRISVRNFS